MNTVTRGEWGKVNKRYLDQVDARREKYKGREIGECWLLDLRSKEKGPPSCYIARTRRTRT